MKQNDKASISTRLLQSVRRRASPQEVSIINNDWVVRPEGFFHLSSERVFGTGWKLSRSWLMV